MAFGADSTTTNLGLTKPQVGSPGWGDKLNSNFDTIDSAIGGLNVTCQSGYAVTGIVKGVPQCTQISTGPLPIGQTNRGTPGADPSTIVSRLVPLDSNYSIPVGAIYVSPTGNDSTGDGSSGNPYATLYRGVSQAPADGTVVLRGGRIDSGWGTVGGANVLTASYTIQAYPHEVPIVVGSNRISSWTSDTCGGNPCWKNTGWTWWTSYGNWAENADLSASVDQFRGVWLDDSPHNGTWTRLVGVATQAEVTSGKMYWDEATLTLYIGDDPSVAGRFVEVTKQNYLFYLNGNNKGFTVKGVVFKGFGTNSTDAAGLFLCNNSDGGVTFDNNVFAYNTYKAIYLAGAYQSTQQYNDIVSNNSFIHNGGGGIASYQRNGLLIQSNYFGDNNTYNFSYNGIQGDAGNKILSIGNATIRDNKFENENSNGLWCDTNCGDFWFLHNIVKGSAQCGVFLEATGNGPFIVAGNLFFNNTASGACFNAGNGRIYNNTAVANGIANIQFEVGGALNAVHNNIFSDVAGTPRAQLSSLSPNGYGQQVTASSKNIYHRTTSASTPTVYFFETSYANLANFTAAYPTLEAGSIAADNVAASTIFTLNQTTGAYSVSGGSIAASAGTTLPSDIATALGVSATTPNIGYLP